MQRKNVLFDWSGTLSDDYNIVYETVMGVFERLGGARMSVDQFRKEIVLPYMKFYRRYFPDLDEEHQRRIFSEIFVTMGDPTIFEGAFACLEGLASQGANMAVLSSHHQHLLTAEATRYGVASYFKEICGGVLDKRETIERLMDRLAFDPSQTVYVGDMVHDVEAGKRAGVTVIGVSWGYDPGEKLLAAGADKVVDSLDDLRLTLLE